VDFFLSGFIREYPECVAALFSSGGLRNSSFIDGGDTDSYHSRNGTGSTEIVGICWPFASGPLRDKRFLIFLLFGCWIQITGGLFPSVQSFTAMKTLALPLIISLALGSWTRLG